MKLYNGKGQLPHRDEFSWDRPKHFAFACSLMLQQQTKKTVRLCMGLSKKGDLIPIEQPKYSITCWDIQQVHAVVHTAEKWNPSEDSRLVIIKCHTIKKKLNEDQKLLLQRVLGDIAAAEEEEDKIPYGTLPSPRERLVRHLHNDPVAAATDIDMRKHKTQPGHSPPVGLHSDTKLTQTSDNLQRKSKLRRDPRTKWVLDEERPKCADKSCKREFTRYWRKHHCRKCKDIFCSACCPKPWFFTSAVRTCSGCASA